MSQTLANHSYVDLSQVGRPDFGGGEGVQCITDLESCCNSTQGNHRGDWYFPDGTRLPFATPNIDTYEQREAQRVDLRRNSGANSPVGIYRCDIPTIAVHDDTDISVRDTVYVGLYTASGGNAIRKSHNNQDCHWLTIIYGPQIYYFSCLYSSPIMSLHPVLPFYLSL